MPCLPGCQVRLFKVHAHTIARLATLLTKTFCIPLGFR